MSGCIFEILEDNRSNRYPFVCCSSEMSEKLRRTSGVLQGSTVRPQFSVGTFFLREKVQLLQWPFFSQPQFEWFTFYARCTVTISLVDLQWSFDLHRSPTPPLDESLRGLLVVDDVVSRQRLSGLYQSVEEKLKVVIVLVVTKIIMGQVK